MKPPAYAIDTSPEAVAIQAECIRKLAPVERVRKACAMAGRGKRMALAAIRRRHPELGPDEVRLKFIELAYGLELANDVRRWRRGRIA